MEYVYAAMLIHKAGKDITEDTVSSVLKAAGVAVDEAKVKALCAALKDVDIEAAIKEAAVTPVAAVAAAPASAGAAEQKEDKKEEDEKKNEEAAAAGLGALFG
ncbi:50S ribosomal protein P1 [Candidatus Woesearchaeota archaeon CG_4_10_14_0_2_um_filter_57_5]|nr:MAG: 50S ribosomal protein P1 [Candidatus Woesearchaeota archaeon CG1_02_57_44]PIN68450.1 MAG: 50S ribosomal protein P1 [Candidatus Woesearchaeota archaeon CG11_big_fil_rev_8_21_14_0_20_57_5]PIZ56449.1 MAG: 50S ribosomal protein P1 [Candidatus Woesearchaeota archaeon CG_4_10_14_0_2_um_filter_57_5]